MRDALPHLVLLPATEPGDDTYGVEPEQVEGFPDLPVHRIRYPRLVWYNESIRDQAVTQIRELNPPSVILVGFSKSGLGAWNTARTIPEIVFATIIFDAPVTHEDRHRWGTGPFYDSDAAWLADLPIRSVDAFRAAMPAEHRLVLISGASFHDQMQALSQALDAAECAHTFHPRPHQKHHWNSGWLEAGVAAALGQSMDHEVYDHA